MFYYVKRFILLIFIIFFVCALLLLGYFGIQDIFGSKAKNYAMKTYEFGQFDIFVLKTTEYNYDENGTCKKELFKECSTDQNLEKEVVFITKNKEKFTVWQHRDGTFSSTYEKDS